MAKQERRKAAPEARERIEERLPLSPDGMPDYPRQGAPEAQERIDERLPPRTAFAASGAMPEIQGPSGGPDAEGGWITREYPDNPAPLVTVSKPPAEDVVEGTYMRRTKPLYGEFGQDQDLEPVGFRRARPMSMREAADAGLFQDSTPRGVEMDPADKVRAGFMRPFAERGQEARPGVTTGRQVDEILQRLERAREMDNRQTDVTARNEQGVSAGEAFRRGLNETRDLRWGASGPTSAVNRAIAERRGRGEQTDEAIRLAKEAPPPQAGALKPLTPKDAGDIIAKRFNLLQGDGVTKVRQEAVTEAKRLETLLRENGYGSLLGDEPEAGPTVRGAAGKEEAGGAAGKGQPGGATGFRPGDRQRRGGVTYVRQRDGTWRKAQA